MVKKLNPSFVEYFAGYLKKLLSDKKKNNETISAEMFQEQVTNAANVYLNENYGADPSAARAAIAQSTPEAECAKAINARRQQSMDVYEPRISDYKTQAEISRLTNAETLIIAKNDHPEVKVWTSKTNMLLYDESTKKMRQKAVPFNIETAVKCGKCWICNTDVMSYTGTSIEPHIKALNRPSEYESGTTPCGDCEHVSAIMASYIAGMLTSSGFAKVYWASYYVACVECNRRKSNYIGVKLNATEGWQVDDNGVNAIVDAIFPMNGVDQHASEYNPIRNALTDKYNVMTTAEKRTFRDKVIDNIKDGTQTWCEAANTNMKKDTATTKRIKMSFNVSKIIVAITGHLNVITSPLQKRANKAVKAGRAQVKPKIGKKRGGGPVGSDDDVDSQETDREGGTQDTQDADAQDNADKKEGAQDNADKKEGAQDDTDKKEGAQDNADKKEGAQDDTDKKEGAQDNADKKEGAHDDNGMIVETDVKATPILHWYNLIGEAEVDVDYDDEDDEEDDRETDAEFNARILKYCDVIVEYIGNTYSQLLFKQYESDRDIFEELMVNLSKSMYDTLESTNEGLPKLTDETLDDIATKFAETGVKVVETPRTLPPRPQPAVVTASPNTRKRDSSTSEYRVGKMARKNDTPAAASAATNAREERVLGKGEALAQVLDTVSDLDGGGSRLNKRHSKNRTKRVSYIKHKQTRKNQHSRKTN